MGVAVGVGEKSRIGVTVGVGVFITAGVAVGVGVKKGVVGVGVEVAVGATIEVGDICGIQSGSEVQEEAMSPTTDTQLCPLHSLW